MITGRMVAEALHEISTYLYEDIEGETALKWGARAIACFQISVREPVHGLAYFLDGEHYLSEALEHAALTGDVKLGQAIKKEVEVWRQKAFDKFR